MLAAVFILVEVCGLARIALFARAVDPQAMGAIVVIGAWLRLVEMATDLSLDRYLLRIARSEADAVRNTAHGAAILRGAAGAALMSLSIMPLVSIYGLGQATPALFLLVLVPLLRGFIHFDYRIENRFLNLRPAIIVELAGAGAGLAAAIAGIFLLPSILAFAISLLVQAIAMLLASHVLASNRYALAFDRSLLAQFWSFGWPLTVNAMLLYAVFQGERLIVAGLSGLDAVAAFAIASQLALLPVLIAGRLALGIALPAIATHRTVTGASVEQDAASFFSAAGVFFALAFALLAPLFIAVIFGQQYVPDETVTLLIAAAAGIRLQKTGLSTLLLARGHSRDLLAGSFARLAGMALGTAGLAATGDLALFVAASAVGEWASHDALWRRTSRSGQRLPWFSRFSPLLIAVPASVFALTHGDIATSGLTAALAALAAAIMLWPVMMRHLPKSRGSTEPAAQSAV